MPRHCDCGPLCLYRAMPFLEGFVIIVLGVFLFMTNYGFMDASIWKWLFPLVIMLVGFKWITNGSGNCDCCEDGMMDEAYDMSMMCCDDEGCECGGDKSCEGESCGCDDKKACSCEGECTCDAETDKDAESCGCGDGCGCGAKK